MPDALKMHILYVMKILIAASPWILSMYILYWLGKHEVWTAETAFRDLMTIAIVALGMGASFLLQSYFQRRTKP